LGGVRVKRREGVEGLDVEQLVEGAQLGTLRSEHAHLGPRRD